MVDVVLAHDWTSIVFHPDAGKRVPADLIVLVRALGVIGHVQAHVLAVADVAVLDQRVRTDAAHANGRSDCEKGEGKRESFR